MSRVFMDVTEIHSLVGQVINLAYEREWCGGHDGEDPECSDCELNDEYKELRKILKTFNIEEFDEVYGV